MSSLIFKHEYSLLQLLLLLAVHLSLSHALSEKREGKKNTV